MSRIILLVALMMAALGAAATAAAADDRNTCDHGQGNDKISACSRLIQRNARDTAAYNNRGNAYWDKHDYDRAITDFDQAIRLDPNYVFAYNNRGNAYIGKHDYDRAIADFDQAIRLDPNYVFAYNNRGTAYNGKHDHDRAITDFDHATRLDPNYANAYDGRGIAYVYKHDYDRAIADYDHAIRLNPNLADAYNGRGYAYFLRGEYDRALEDAGEAIRLDPESAYAWGTRGEALIGKGEYDRAISDLDKSIKLDPALAESYSDRGYAYGLRDRPDDRDRAMADLDKGIALNPKIGRSYANRATILERRGDLDRAISDAGEAIRLDPKDPFGYTVRGNAYIDKGEYGLAVADFDQALRLYPRYAEALLGRDRAGRAAAASRANPNPVPDQTPVVAAQGGKRALVIGIDAYPGLGPAAQLERAVADADAVGDKLASFGFQVTRLTSASQTSLDGLLQGFEDFRKSVARNDMVVLFYAGHGMGLPDGTYLVPGDVREASLQAEATARRVAINENEFTEGLQRAGAGIIVAVIDACRNDLFSRAVRRTVGSERGLRPVETEGIYKLYSASEGQTALDQMPGGDGSKNSVFTRVFLQAIGTPGLNLNALGARVRDEVYRLARTANHQQTPAVYDRLIGSTEVYFAGLAAPDAARP